MPAAGPLAAGATAAFVTLVAPPVVVAGGATYELGAPGDVVLVGDWDCDGLRTPALYRPATGAIYEFDGWGDGVRSSPPRPSGVVGGIATVEAERSGCERLAVGRKDRSAPMRRAAVTEGE